MLRYIYGADLGAFPTLRDTMFQDRADQFKRRLDWDVEIDASGAEKDAYDDLNPLYVIWEKADGRHGGSMRFLPTTGQTMLNDHFQHLTDDVRIESPLIWESTRFCLSDDAGPQVSAALMLGGAEVGKNFYLNHAVGVFDARMVRVYRRIGWAPTILGTEGQGRDAISVGLWDFSEPVKPQLLERSGVTDDQSRQWFDLSFGAPKAAFEAEIA